MNKKLKNRIIALEYAHDNLELAKEYEAFLSESENEEDAENRIICLDKRAGMPMSEIRELFDYLIK